MNKKLYWRGPMCVCDVEGGGGDVCYTCICLFGQKIGMFYIPVFWFVLCFILLHCKLVLTCNKSSFYFKVHELLIFIEIT